MLQKPGPYHPFQVPASLQGGLTRESGQLSLDFNRDKMILSYIEVIEPGDVSYWELVKLEAGQWACLTGDADPRTFGNERLHHGEVYFDDENPSSANQVSPKTHQSRRTSDAEPDEDNENPEGGRTANEKIAQEINERGFFRCKLWPDAVSHHPELKVFNSIAVNKLWLDKNGRHPNHVRYKGPGPATRESVEGTTKTSPVKANKTRGEKQTPTKPTTDRKPREVATLMLWKGFILKHHNYLNDLNLTPITPTQLEEAGICSKASASRHFKDKFGSFKKYKRLCEQNPVQLKYQLELLAGDVNLEQLKSLSKAFKDINAQNPADGDYD